MDPIAHTLMGAALAETGLRRTTRLATPALLIGANLPDIDAVTSFIDRDLMYGFRRGWTHGVLAMVVLPWLLVGGLLLYARLRPDSSADPPLGVRQLVLLAHLAVLSHPLLDWLNNYGVRLLMPLSDTWYYGDSIFIVDPWMWLLLASGVVLARTGSRLSLLGWVTLGVLLSVLVIGSDRSPMPAKVLWAVWVAAIAAARLSATVRARASTIARAAIGVLLLYVGGALAGTAVARSQARIHVQGLGVVPRRVVAGPMAANPFRRDIVVVEPDRYRFLNVDWLADPAITPGHASLPINDGPLSQAALAAPEIAGYVQWLRLPAFAHEPTPSGTRVWIRDVRYSRTGGSLGHAYVDFDRQGRRSGAWIGR